MRASDAAHDVRAAVLLVIGVEDEEDVQCALNSRVHFVLRLRHLKQHVQEVPRVAEIVIGIDVGKSKMMPIRVGSDRGHFPDQTKDLELAGLGIVDVLCIRIERGESRNGAYEHPHRVRVVVESLHELLGVLMDHCVVRYVVHPFIQLPCCWKLPVQDQVGYLEIGAFLRELLDWIAAISQDPFVAIDEGDLALARCRIHERGIVRHQTKIVIGCLDLAKVHRLDGSVGDRDRVFFSRSTVDDREVVRHHQISRNLKFPSRLRIFD